MKTQMPRSAYRFKKCGFGLTTLTFLLASCGNTAISPVDDVRASQADSLVLLEMIRGREKAMINKDIARAMEQFSGQPTWINSQGYFFQGKEHVERFHGMLAGNDSMDYYYEAGEPRVRIIDNRNALAYYGWKMFWYRKDNPADTTFREIGLMTLSAHKQDDTWQWIAVTNQHTPWFYETIEAVSVDEE